MAEDKKVVNIEDKEKALKKMRMERIITISVLAILVLGII